MGAQSSGRRARANSESRRRPDRPRDQAKSVTVEFGDGGVARTMSSHRVAVVVDRTFGERLLPLARRLHVWVCDTPTNHEAAEKAWAAIPPGAVWNEVGVTTFRVSESDSPEEMVIRHIGDIDLHHPTWSQIEVHGVRLNDGLRAAWREYGADEFRETGEGFVCSRALGDEALLLI